MLYRIVDCSEHVSMQVRLLCVMNTDRAEAPHLREDRHQISPDVLIVMRRVVHHEINRPFETV